MHFRTLLRTSPALWTAPVWFGVIVLYFFHVLHIAVPYAELMDGPLWAATQVQIVLEHFYAFSYAFTAGLAVWEGGRLRQDDVWQLAPARSRYRVAAHVLVPVVIVGWMMLLFPVTMRLIETRLIPSPAALTPLFMGMVIVCAYAVIGCAISQFTPRVVAAPLAMVTVFYVVNVTHTFSPPFWPRHVSGRIATSVAFGEYLAPVSVLVPLAFVLALAIAAASGWAGAAQRARRVIRGLASGTALAVMAGSAFVASGWGVAHAPVSAGHASMRCTGDKPRVCMAVDGGAVGELDRLRAEILQSINALHGAGVEVRMPDRVQDSLLHERRHLPSTDTEWQAPLSRRPNADAIRYLTLRQGVKFPCAFPASYSSVHGADWIVNHDAALLWAATVMGIGDQFLAERRDSYAGDLQNADEVLDVIMQRTEYALALPKVEQTAWFHKEQKHACALVGETT